MVLLQLRRLWWAIKVWFVAPEMAGTVLKIPLTVPPPTPDGWQATIPKAPLDVPLEEVYRVKSKRLVWAITEGLIEVRRDAEDVLWWRVRDPDWWAKAGEVPEWLLNQRFQTHTPI